MQGNNSKLIIAILSVLFLIAAILGYYSWNENNTLKSNNSFLSTKVSKLEETKENLLADMDILEEELEELVSENERQSLALKESNNALASSNSELKKLQKKYKKDIGWMKAELKNLRAAKAELTALVSQLQQERSSGNVADGSLLESRLTDIENRNKELQDQLAKAKERNSALAGSNSNLDIAAIQATNTRVDIRKKGNKPTGSFRRAREIIVSFDLNHLAQTKEGVHDLFIVIKDAKGNLAKVSNPVKKKIVSQVDGTVEEIIAQQMITADLFEKVRLQFKVKPERKTLKKGYYWVYIYADWGLIGRTEFELR